MSSRLKRTLARAATAFAMCAAGTASAATVQAELSKVGGNTWDVSFTVGEDPGQLVEAFSIYFDWTQVSNLVVTASPADWDSLAIQADSALAADAILDSLVMVPSVSAGKALSGFGARFDWMDAAGPAVLRYTINDPLTFAPIQDGAVSFVVTTSVPEPTSGSLAALAILALALSKFAQGKQQGSDAARPWQRARF